MLAGRALAYYLFSQRRSGRGMQDPFVRRLTEEVFFPGGDEVAACEQLRKVRQRFLADRSEILPYDLGAGHGGRKGVRRARSIRNIARHSSGAPRYHRLLCRLSRYLRPAVVLELGTALGMGTLALALGHPPARIITIEGDPSLASRAQEMLAAEVPGSSVTLLRGAFDEILPALLRQTEPIDLLFLDGHHEEQAVLRYFEWLRPHLHPESVAVIDDIHWSKGMLRAWDKMREHEQTSLAIDIFRMGLLFFDPSLPKETITLRY